jgi:hypothetical protein
MAGICIEGWSITMSTTTEKLFADATELIHARGSQYGHPYSQHSRIAELWSAYFHFPITANQVAMAMCLVKISRVLNPQKYRIITKTQLRILLLPKHAMRRCKTAH